MFKVFEVIQNSARDYNRAFVPIRNAHVFLAIANRKAQLSIASFRPRLPQLQT